MEGGKSTALRTYDPKSRRMGPADMPKQLGKVPPQAVEIEEAVLGALMLERDALTNVIEILKPESFYRDQNRLIFEAIVHLFNNSEPVDIKTVVHQLRKSGQLEIVGGPHYVSELTTKVNSAANIEYHARIIAEQSIKRDLIHISSDIQHDAYEDTTDVFNLLDKAQQSLFDVSEAHIRKNFDKMSSLMHQAIQEIEERKNQKDGLTGIASGFTSLDRITSGWQRSDLVIIAARPGMGKCLGKGTKVLMYDGTLQKVENVKQGDQLMGDDSTPRRVLSLARGRERMYWVHQNHGMSYRVNESHILSLKRSRNEGQHKNGDMLNIEVRDYLARSDKFKSNYKGYKVPVEFPEKDVPVHPYFLGLWLGDGHSYSSRVTTIDQEVIDYMQGYAEDLNVELVEYVQEGKTKNYGTTKGFRGQRKFESLQKELRHLNLLGNKHIPHQYLSNSTGNRLQLLAGLIDSDGHYNKEFNVYEITQKREDLAKEIKLLCDTLGFKTSLRKKKATIAGTPVVTEVFRVRISGDLDRVPVRVERKKARTWNSLINWRQTGITVEYDCEDDYYGFEIDGNRLFLLEDMTVTHNTAFVVSSLRNAAIDFQTPVAIFSLEMSSVQLVHRMVSAEAELESDKLRKGNLEAYEWQQLISKTGRLSEAPIFIDDTPALSILELRAKSRRLVAQHGVSLIVIDYLQLMTGDTSKGGGNREQEIASISRALKGIAKELNVPVIALSQLSRAVETRGGDKRPQLSDLRESGSIEQDADMVMFLYRPEYYGITQDENGMPLSGIGEVIIAKNRHGKLENVPLKFIGKFTKFEDLDAPMDTSPTYGAKLPPSGPSNTDFTITLPSRANKKDDDEMPF